MASWIQDALRLLQHCKITSNTSLSSKVCHEQSSILRGALVHVHGFLEQVGEVALDPSGANTKRSLVAVGENVKCMIQVASRLITFYEKDDWVITALLAEESREDFKDAFVELYDSIELASGFMLEAARSERDKSRIREAYSSCLMRKSSVSMLELAAVNDRKQMMRMGLSSDDSEGGSVLQLLCTMLLEKSAPLLDRSQLQFKQHLKQGGFGTVYEACWNNNVDVAVKVFSSGDSSFRRELAALASCKHPNVLRIFGYVFDSEKQQHSLVMEKMDMDLGDLINRNAGMSPLDCVFVLLEIAKGMAWLHSKDVIHRDLKPGNILIVSRSDIMDVRIADFGLSRTGFATSRVSFATSKLGTRIYMAPEVWNSQHYSKKSDVFSYAMICYQMLTGRLPFQGEVLESSDYMLRVCNGMRPLDAFPDICPVELAELTRRCWSGEASERPSFSEVCQTLKLMKVKLLTSLENWSEVRKKLLANGSTGSSSSAGLLNQNHSRTRVDTDSLFRRSRVTSSDPGSGRRAPPAVATPHKQSTTYPPPSAQASRPPSKKEELLKLVQRGRMLEAFQQALALKDPDTLWWLAAKVESSLMHTFDERMVFTTAEQIVEVIASDPAGVCGWLTTAVEILTKHKVKNNSTRLYRLLGRIAQGLHGMIAVTPKDSELVGFLRAKLRDCNSSLQMVETQIRLFGPD